MVVVVIVVVVVVAIFPLSVLCWHSAFTVRILMVNT